MELKLYIHNKQIRSKAWLEGNVWSVVCAMELGLLTESSLKNISIRMLSDDRKIVKKNSLEYSINTTNFVSSWPFINDGRSKFKLDKNYMPNESKLKRRRKRRKKLSHKKKLSSNKKENQRIYKLRSSTINNNDNGNNNNNKRDNNKINNSLDSDSASEKSFEDYEENNVGNTVETNVGSLKPDWSYVDHKKEIKSVHLDNTKTHSNDSIKDDSGEAISVYSSNIKINKNKCERSKFDEIHDIPLAKRLSNEIKKENMVDNLSMCFRDYSSSSNLPGKNSNLSSAENKTIVDNNTSNTKKIEDIKVKKDNSFKNDFDEDDSDQNLRRVTRGLTKINKSVNENFLGRLVWGCCSGWWPALIIDAEHVGMVSEPGKLWVFWIGDSLISLLNEKTQIKPFTDNLELRLKQRSESTESMHCINLTIQMIREKCSSLLTKPYHIWIQKNFIDKTRKEIKFYPYPTKIQERLDFLKEKNSRINEKYMLDQKQQSSEKTKRQVEKCTDTSFNEKNTELLPLMEQRPGVIAWAKIAGYNWWPAMIIDYRDCCLREPSFGCQWIMWYGDYTFSQIHHRAFMKFVEGMEKMQEYIQRTKKHFYLLGVLDASKDYYLRLGYDTENWTIADAMSHASQRNVCSQVRNKSLTVEKCSEESKKYSALILSKLNQLKINVTVDDQRKNDIINSNISDLIKTGMAVIEDICLRCLKISQEEREQHPFFKGSLCKDCSEIFKPSIFVIGTDGKCYFCTVCAGSGTVVMCDNENCPRVYCTACLKYLIYPNEYHDILLEDPWKCLLCKMDNVSTPNRVILPRPEWKEKFTHMFRTSPDSNIKSALDNNWVKRKMRVLSLFDGLATGLVVLLKLGITIEVYYASEIDKDALTVSSSHFGDRIIYLGDVRDITVQKIKEIAPIDLVMGGSPCNDLSLVNPARLGLHDPNGTGVLFFEYKRIKELVKKANNGRHLFWLYENVANMETKYRLEINRCLGQEPDVIDSADFSPQHRLRLYWHNLPISVNTLPFENQHDLQDVLTPHCNRYALVKKIRTVTTNTNSLKQGKLALKPILMKDESDLLWITELEEIFGFPRHYTDVKNLSADKRQKLIGKSWSVQTLTAIFLPLRSLYEHD